MHMSLSSHNFCIRTYTYKCPIPEEKLKKKLKKRTLTIKTTYQTGDFKYNLLQNLLEIHTAMIGWVLQDCCHTKMTESEG